MLTVQKFAEDFGKMKALEGETLVGETKFEVAQGLGRTGRLKKRRRNMVWKSTQTVTYHSLPERSGRNLRPTILLQPRHPVMKPTTRLDE